MTRPHYRYYFFISALFHLGVLIVLVLSFDAASPLPVIENTNKNDVISAVILGDSVKSKVLPKEKIIEKIAEEKPKPEKQIAPPPKKEVVIKKKEKPIAKPFQAKDLLSDIQKQKHIQKTVSQKKLQKEFQKTLHQQAEKSLRQRLLDEDIKLSSSQLRESQGEINKYKALILQAISEHWVIPSQANKQLSCVLMIHLASGGVVLGVEVTKSSGDPALDSSARAAVFKASPLPVPADPKEFDLFRRFILKVKPVNILNSASR